MAGRISCYFKELQVLLKKYHVQEKAFWYTALIVYAETGSAVWLLLLLATYTGNGYRHWYALPEE